MTTLDRYLPPVTVTVEPVRHWDMTDVPENVLWVIGRARRTGQLVRVDNTTDHPDGTVTARIHHTGALALPGVTPLELTPDIGRQRWDAGDYTVAVCVGGAAAIAGTAVWLIYSAVTALGALLAIHSGVILPALITTVAVIGALLLILVPLAGKGCPGLHCGGCKG